MAKADATAGEGESLVAVVCSRLVGVGLALSLAVALTAGNASAKRPATLQVSTSPPLPQPHPNRASASRKASTARAARESDRARSDAASVDAGTRLSPAAPPLPVERPPQRSVSQSSQDASDKAPAATAAREAEAPSAAPEPERPAAWTEDEVAAARRECDELLGSITADAELQSPLRQGDCGTPAPLKVARIGSNGGIAFEPAGVLNCRMVARLHQWLETVAQPAARETLGSPIVKLSNASAYMCRNRYNDAAAKISEHAFANALDISALVLADGRRIDVKSFWGPLASARTPALAPVEKPPAAATVPLNGMPAASTRVQVGPRPTPLGRKQLTPRAVTAGLKTEAPNGTGANTAPATSPALPPAPVTAEQKFLRRLHDSACGIFSTVLGPEANAAHHDHFHFDLQKRRSSAYCQ